MIKKDDSCGRKRYDPLYINYQSLEIGKGVHQGCILSPCLTYMQSTS